MFLNFATTSIADKVLDRGIPFEIGEKLTYKGKWGTIPAGELTLEVLPEKTINGIKAYHFVMITKTNEMVDFIYKIRDRQDSYVDTGITHSIFYKKKTESKHPRDVRINFNWKKKKATYTNFNKKKPPIDILPGTFDTLAFFYALRYKVLKENSEIDVPITDGKLNINVKVIIGKRDRVEIEGKMYDVLEITPDMKTLDEVVKNGDDSQLKVWVTADERKIPIKIRTKVGIISFDFDLITNTSSNNKKI